MENNNKQQRPDSRQFPNPLDVLRAKVGNMLKESSTKPASVPEINGENPVIIMGGTNTINVIRNQNNDQSAVRTCRELLDQEKRSDESQRKVIDMIIGMVPGITEQLMKIIASKNKVAAQSPVSPEPVQPEAKPKRKYTKTKSKK